MGKRKTRAMNLGLQKYVLNKILKKQLKLNDMDEDSVWTDVMEGLDDGVTLDSHIMEFRAMGLIKNPPETADEEDTKIQQELETYMKRIKDNFIGTMNFPFYHCLECNEKFITQDPKEMLKHYQKKHDLVDIIIPPDNKYDLEWIILDGLIDEFLDNTKKYYRRKYIEISNIDLWTLLKSKLDYTISYQKPRHILNKLGMLKRGNKERARMGYNNNSCRMYYININDLKEVVQKSKFVDLKVRLNLAVDEPSSIIDEEDKSETETNEQESSDTSGLESDDNSELNDCLDDDGNLLDLL